MVYLDQIRNGLIGTCMQNVFFRRKKRGSQFDGTYSLQAVNKINFVQKIDS